MTKLAVSTALYNGGQDWIADPTDVSELIPKIRPVLRSVKTIPPYEHLDFIVGMNARELIYDEIITDMLKTEQLSRQ